MPRPVPQREIDVILRLVEKHPHGIAIAEIERQLQPTPARRTLVRRLAMLVEEGRLQRCGERRGAIYLPSAAVAMGTEPQSGVGRGEVTLPSPQVAGKGEIYVPTSQQGREIRDYVRQPLARRAPVAYQREFLDAYVPNRTIYLTDKIREHLHRIGQSADAGLAAGTYARQILDRLLIDLSWASSRLEGNTYSQLDTERLIRFGQVAEGKDAQETQMILNHKAAIEFLVDAADEIGFNRHTFLNLHALLADGLLRDPEAGGRLRWIPVGVSGTVFHPLSVPQVIDECFRQILDTVAAVTDPFEQAFFIMVHIPYLQPFEDVNKRVSRLGANISLIKHNLSPLSFVDVPESAYVEGTLGVYELNRIELLRDVFIWAYERSVQRYLVVRKTMAEPDPFRLRYRDALIDVVGSVIRGRMVDVMAVLSEFAAKRVPAEDRDKFVKIASEEIGRLHEGTIARFRLRPSEFEAWKEALNKVKS